MSERYVCGIDPGVTGGVAFVRGDEVIAIDIPSADGEIDVGAVVDQIKFFNPLLACIERASARPGQGVSSTFKFGAAYGALRACVAACGVPLYLVAATKWKKSFGLGSDKEKSRAMAIRLWPRSDAFRRKKDHGRAEAALIARYGEGMTDCLARRERDGEAA